jgi:hypothetical protein
MAPEKIFVIDAVASATPSMKPIVTMLAPSTEAMKTGKRLCTSSEDASMKSDPRPSAQIAAGTARSVLGRSGGDWLLVTCPFIVGGSGAESFWEDG